MKVRSNPVAPFTPTSPVKNGPPAWLGHVRPRVLGGYETLYVVGESYRQEALWVLAGGRRTGGVRAPIEAVLIAEDDNPVDDNAVSIWIAGRLVGYVERSEAPDLRRGLLALQTRMGGPVALSGHIVGRDLGPDVPHLGVFLDHDPVDFGLRPPDSVLPGDASMVRTGYRGSAPTTTVWWPFSRPSQRIRSGASPRCAMPCRTRPTFSSATSSSRSSSSCCTGAARLTRPYSTSTTTSADGTTRRWTQSVRSSCDALVGFRCWTRTAKPRSGGPRSTITRPRCDGPSGACRSTATRHVVRRIPPISRDVARRRSGSLAVRIPSGTPRQARWRRWSVARVDTRSTGR